MEKRWLRKREKKRRKKKKRLWSVGRRRDTSGHPGNVRKNGSVKEKNLPFTTRSKWKTSFDERLVKTFLQELEVTCSARRCGTCRSFQKCVNVEGKIHRFWTASPRSARSSFLSSRVQTSGSSEWSCRNSTHSRTTVRLCTEKKSLFPKLLR